MRLWIHLHSTMFLLIHLTDITFDDSIMHLHSTMFLLIRASPEGSSAALVFTFHNVSINSGYVRG